MAAVSSGSVSSGSDRSGGPVAHVDPVRDLIRERSRTSRNRGQAMGELCRPGVVRVPCLVFVVAGVIIGLSALELLAGLLLIVAAGSAACALNDRADVETDRANGRLDRPLVSGALDERDVSIVVAGAAVVAAAVQPFLPQPRGLAVTVAALMLGAASALEPVALQRRGLVGLLVLGCCYLVLPVAPAAGGTAGLRAAPLAVMGAGVLAHKDARDELGDRAAGKATLLVRVGSARMVILAFAVSAVGAAALLATAGSGWWCLPATVMLAELAVMARSGPRPGPWMWARIALVLSAVLVAVLLSQQVATGGAAL